MTNSHQSSLPMNYIDSEQHLEDFLDRLLEIFEWDAQIGTRELDGINQEYSSLEQELYYDGKYNDQLMTAIRADIEHLGDRFKTSTNNYYYRHLPLAQRLAIEKHRSIPSKMLYEDIIDYKLEIDSILANSISTFRKYYNDDEQYELIREYRKHNDIDSRNELICSIFRYVKSLAYRTAFVCGVPFADLFQSAVYEVFNAFDKWNEYRGVGFINYASYHIRNGINKEILRQRNNVYGFNSLYRYKNRISKVANRYYSENGYDASDDEIKEIFNIDSYTLAAIQNLDDENRIYLDDLIDEDHLDESLTDSSEEEIITNIDIIIDEEREDEFECLMDKEYNRHVIEYLKNNIFRYFEWNFMDLYYLEGKSIEEIAKKFYLSRERVRQVLASCSERKDICDQKNTILHYLDDHHGVLRKMNHTEKQESQSTGRLAWMSDYDKQFARYCKKYLRNIL